MLVLADAAFVTSDVPLAREGAESVVRVDSGLPIPLDVLPRDERVATLRIAQDRLFEALRGGEFASIQVTMANPTEAAEIERVFLLDALAPMLDELERCAIPADAS